MSLLNAPNSFRYCRPEGLHCDWFVDIGTRQGIRLTRHHTSPAVLIQAIAVLAMVAISFGIVSELWLGQSLVT